MSEKTNKWFDMSRATNAEGEKSTETEISIYDKIGGWGVTAIDYIHQLTALGDVDTINLRIARSVTRPKIVSRSSPKNTLEKRAPP